MKFNNYLNESTTGYGSWVKYFKGQDKITYVKKISPIYNNVNKKTGEEIEQGEEILVPSSSEFVKGKIIVIYKGVPARIQFSNIDKGAKKGGERLKIPANVLIKTAQNISSTVGSKTFNSKIFYNAMDLSTTLNNSIQHIKTIPDDLKTILINYFENNDYSIIDWMGYDNKGYMNEVAKYLGEIIIGLCVLNNNFSALSKNIFKGKVKSFIMPTDSSFAGVDSMFEMEDGSFVPISSKSGKGAPASFNANVMPVLCKNNIKTKSKLLSYMIDIQNKNQMKNLEFLYHVGMNYIMAPYLSKTSMGKKIMQKPYSIYNNIRTNNISDNELYVIDIVKKGKWDVPNTKKLIDKLPNSLTYFICQNIAAKLNKDASAKETIINALSAKQFWQANLEQAKFYKGKIKFKMISSGSNNVKIVQGKGSMNSVTSEQGRLSYFIL